MKTILPMAILLCFAFSSKAQNRRINLFTDADLIKLSNYIKDLEYKDSVNTRTIKIYEEEFKAILAKKEEDEAILNNENKDLKK
jgi:acetyl-CoA carboxylase beta subunit